MRERLPEDCLLGGRVHPEIAERLDRIRQLPVAAVANFLGMEASGPDYFLYWQAIDAKPLAEIDVKSLSASQCGAIFDQVNQTVVAMHAHGIVHGAINAHNVLIDSRGRVLLTRVSPLLYDDPRVDLDAVRNLGLVDQTADFIARSEARFSIERIRVSQRRLAGWTVVAGTLIFIALLWYSLGQ